MAYCTLDDIKERLPEKAVRLLTDDAGSGWVDETVTAALIAAADAEIDSILGSRFSVPFTAPVPEVVKQHSVTGVIYRLFSRAGRVTEQIRADYEDSIARMRDLARGIGTIPGAAAVTSPAESGPVASTSPADRVFTRGSGSQGTSGTLDDY